MQVEYVVSSVLYRDIILLFTITFNILDFLIIIIDMYDQTFITYFTKIICMRRLFKIYYCIPKYCGRYTPNVCLSDINSNRQTVDATTRNVVSQRDVFRDRNGIYFFLVRAFCHRVPIFLPISFRRFRLPWRVVYDTEPANGARINKWTKNNRTCDNIIIYV